IVTYDSMWGSTAKMATAIMEGLRAGGAVIKVMDLKVSHRSDVVTELLEAGGLVVGSSTLNNGILPRVADFLTYLRGLRPKNLLTLAFGSYGWSGESVGKIEEELSGMGLAPMDEGIKSLFVPDQDVLGACFDAGKRFAARLQ
ncbi:MAG: flavodoxin domain-containing protein, partial [Limnochordia bacterium]|nr:flavodoxin domain-containing protein [Limnochordia bacterium]